MYGGFPHFAVVWSAVCGTNVVVFHDHSRSLVSLIQRIKIMFRGIRGGCVQVKLFEDIV